METALVLVMHGAIPRDFPREELREYFQLHEQVEHGRGSEELRARYEELERRLRGWPRTAENDPFYAGSQELAEALQAATGLKVWLAFNEFCAPSTPEALRQAYEAGARRIIVLTPMMTRGGGHSERDIPRDIARFRERYPDAQVEYLWPLDPRDVARFLAEQLQKRFGLTLAV